MKTTSQVKITEKDQEELSAPGLRVFFNITGLWSMNPEGQMKLLGITEQETYENWQEPETQAEILLGKDTLERISYVVGIYKQLHSLIPGEKQADNWVNRPNTASIFGGKPALDRMLSGEIEDLRMVRNYLLAQRGSLA